MGIVFKASEVKKLIVDSAVSLYQKAINENLKAMGSGGQSFPADEMQLRENLKRMLLKNP